MEVVENEVVVYESGICRPEPTRFWILDRRLRSSISKLEAEGWIKRLSEEITKDEEMFNLFVILHEREIEVRRKLLEERFPEVWKGEERWAIACKKVLLDTDVGIGGIRRFRSKPFRLKCLHLWAAYHLGDERFRNPIGEFVLSKL